MLFLKNSKRPGHEVSAACFGGYLLRICANPVGGGNSHDSIQFSTIHPLLVWLVRYVSGMEFFYWEHEIPILSPYNVAILNIKTIELTFVEILIVLRMRVTTDEVTNIYRLHGIVAKPKAYRQVTSIFCLCDIQSAHSMSPKYSKILGIKLEVFHFTLQNYYKYLT